MERVCVCTTSLASANLRKIEETTIMRKNVRKFQTENELNEKIAIVDNVIKEISIKINNLETELKKNLNCDKQNRNHRNRSSSND